eukprot:531365-Hanusia_phi.AAC.1
MALNAAGTRMATCDLRGRIKVWPLAEKEEVVRPVEVSNLSGGVTALRFPPENATAKVRRQERGGDGDGWCGAD